MTIKITIEFDSISDAAAFLRGASEGSETAAPATEVPTQASGHDSAHVEQPAVAAPAKRRGRPPRALAPVEAPTEPVAPVQAETAPAQDRSTVPAAPLADTPAALPAATAPTMADAQKALEAVFEAKGFAGAQQLLQSIGAARLRDVPAEQYGELIAKAKELA